MSRIPNPADLPGIADVAAYPPARIHDRLLKSIPDDPADTKRGRSGLTYAQWQRQRIADFLAGGRDTLSEPYAYEREFVADDDGCVSVEKILNKLTGALVTLEPPLRVHVDDLDGVIAQHQERFLAEWNARKAEA